MYEIGASTEIDAVERRLAVLNGNSNDGIKSRVDGPASKKFNCKSIR